MTIMHRLLPDGGFVCGDTETSRTSYAYPTSSHATNARQDAGKIAARMIRAANQHSAFEDSKLIRDYHARNWAKIGGRVS